MSPDPLLRLLVAMAILPLINHCGSGPPSIQSIRLGEGVLHKKAVEKILPVYPETSMRERVTGVGVASLRIGKDGRVDSVEILESPDAATGQSIREAVSKWVFEPTTIRGQPVEVVGKLTFYFRFEEGTGPVVAPAIH